MELHYFESCLHFGKKDASCFWVEMTYNGKPMHFDSCIEKNKAIGNPSLNCYYPDFMEYLSGIQVQGDVDELCQ